MCFNCVNDEEFLKELGRRVDQKRITWDICYYYDKSITKAEFKAEEQKFSLSFSVNTNIDKNYFVRNVYKQLEPELLRIRSKQAESQQKTKESELDKVFKEMAERQKK